MFSHVFIFMKKKIPDDVILVFCGIFAAILFMWTNLNNVKTNLDYWILISGVIGMILIPMVWSSIVYYRGNR